MRKGFKNAALITITTTLNLAVLLSWTMLDDAPWRVLWKIAGLTAVTAIWDMLFMYANKLPFPSPSGESTSKSSTSPSEEHNCLLIKMEIHKLG